jgi:hypothetical protein
MSPDKSYLVALTVFALSVVHEIAHADQWAKTYEVSNRDVRAQFIRQTSDEGFIVAGHQISLGTDNWDILIMKLDAEGNLMWQKTYGGSSFDDPACVQETSDGGYVVAASTSSFSDDGNMDAWILKLDSEGNIVWQKTYGGPNQESAHSIRQTSDGGYIVAADTASLDPGSSDAWVLKLDPEGNVVWQKAYGGKGSDWVWAVQQTNDGGYILAGGYGFSQYDYDLWVLKLGEKGNVEWQKTYGGALLDSAYSVQQTSDGGYIVAGWTDSFGASSGDAWVLKLDQDGNVQWQKRIGGNDYDIVYSVQETFDGGYILAGHSHLGAGNDAWVLKLDGQGDIVWQKVFGGGDGDLAFSAQQTSDGGYVLAGATESFGAGNGRAFVLKLDGNGDITGCPLQGPSEAVIRNTYVDGVQTSVTPKGVDLPGANTNVTSFGSNVVESVICYHIPNRHELIITKSGAGIGTVMSTPLGISCGNNCSEIYDYGTVVTLRAIPAEGSVFVGWGDDCVGTDATTYVTIDDNRTCSARFDLMLHTLVISKSGTGDGVVNATGCTPGWTGKIGTCTASHGTAISLSGAAETGSTFAGWSGGTGSASICAGTSICSFTITSDSGVTATFVLNEYQVTVTARGNGSGGLTSNPAGIDFSYPHTTSENGSFSHGSNVVLMARASSDSTASWVTCPGTSSGNGTQTAACSIIGLAGSTSAQVEFSINRYTLTVRTQGSGLGTVTSDPGGISCPGDCSEAYDLGTPVTLMASAAAGSVFEGWSEDCTSTGSNQAQVTMDGDKSCTATFTAQPPDTYTLTVARAGMGSGTVSSVPGGINCGVDCMEWFPKGSKVFLTASPENGSIFAGWSGDCVGRKATKKVVMKSDKRCTANFALGPDLVVSVVSVSPEPVQAGEKVTVTYQVTNQGDYTTGKAGKVSFVLSSDSTIELTDTLLGSQKIPKLSPGASVTKTKAVRIGKDMPVGDYFLGLIVDAFNTISEPDETNNTAYVPLTVE